MAYERQIATAKRLIQKRGRLVTWFKNTNVQNNAQPWKSTAAAPEGHPDYMVFLTPRGGMSELIHLLQGSEVPQGAPNALMASVPFTPEIDDTVVTVDETFVIKAIDIIKPDGTPILYKLKFA